jgi:hypothetical protein
MESIPFQSQAYKIDDGPSWSRHYDYNVDHHTYDQFGNYVVDEVPPIEPDDITIFDSMGLKDASKIIFDLLTASDNQNATVLITGPPGAGKDNLADALSYNLAIRIANYRWSEPGRWREAYPYWRNTAIIDPKEIIRVMEGNGELEVRRLDDVFRAMDRAEYYTKEHQYMNTLQAVNRTENSCTIMSAQYTKMIDSIIRNLSRFWIRVFRNTLWRQLGYNEFTMYVLDKNEMDSKSVPYNRSIRDIVNKRRRVHDRGASVLPPAELEDYYRPRRKAAVDNMKKSRKESKKKEDEEEKDRQDNPQSAAEFVRRYRGEHLQNNNDKGQYIDEVWEACKNNGFKISRSSVTSYLSRR